MAREIVVGYDGSGYAKDALRLGCELAYTDTELTVVHSYELPPNADADVISAAEQEGERILDEARQIVCEHLPTVNCVLIAKDPAHGLAEVASERNAFLIVVGSRGLGHVKALLGSVSHRLLHTTDKPVLIVPALSKKGAQFVAGKVQ